MTNSWILKSHDVPLVNVSQMSGVDQNKIRQLWASGILGAPPKTTEQAKVPLLQIAALLALLDARKGGVSHDRMSEALPCISGAAYIHLALTELAKGRWVAVRGSPELTHQLWQRMKSEEGKSLIEQQLPGSVETKRFACFSERAVTTCDDLNVLHDDQAEWPLVVFDSWSIGRRIKRALPGTLFSTEM